MQQLKGLSKFSNSKKKSENEKIKIEIDQEVLSDLLYFVLDYSFNSYCNKKFLRNYRKLLELMDTSIYGDAPETMLCINATLEVISCYLDKDITTPSIIASEVYEAIPEGKSQLEDIFEDMYEYYHSEDVLVQEDMSRFLCKFVEDRLNYCNMFKCKELLMPLFERLEDSENLGLLNKTFSMIVDKIYTDSINTRMHEDQYLDDFSTQDENSMETILDKTIREYQKPNNRINTGIKYFNALLGGGLENGRFYLACGLPKSFKSGLLLNIMVWAAKYNKFEFEYEDKGKIPTIFYLTMENSVKETINRIYVILTGKSIKHLDLREAKRVLKEELLDKYGVALEIRYRANKSINTIDFDNMISEIETNNQKVVLAIQDYTKRIRSSNPDKELRLELANVSDDFCSIAKRRNIPIVSGAQLNRVAMQKVEEILAKGGKDVGKNLNMSHIGESAGLIENADFSFTLYREKLDTGEEFLSFHLIASREEEPEVTYFAQRFENGMKLEEDFDLDKSVSLNSIGGSATDGFNPNEARKKFNRSNRVRLQDDYDEDDDDENYEEDDDDLDFTEEDASEDKKEVLKKKNKSKAKKGSKKKSKKGSASSNVSKKDKELLAEDDDDVDFEDEEDDE